MFEKLNVEGASNKRVGEVKPNIKKSVEEQAKIKESKTTAEQIQEYFKKSKEHKETLEQLRKVDSILKNSQDIPKAKIDELKELELKELDDANHELQKQINESKKEVEFQNQRNEQKKIIELSLAQDKVEQTDSTLNQKDVP